MTAEDDKLAALADDDDPDIIYSTRKELADADKYIQSECSGNQY